MSRRSLPSRLLQRFGHKVAAVQRNLPWPSRTRIRHFHPIPNTPADLKLVVLCEPRTQWDGLWSLWSWLRFFPGEMEATLFIDGPVDPAWEAQAQQVIPGLSVHSLPTWLERRRDQLGEFAVLMRHYRFAGKLALLTALQRESPIVYCDADVVAFADPAELRVAIRVGESRYLADHSYPGWDPQIKAHAGALGVACDCHLNSGLLFIPRASLREDLWRELLRVWKPQGNRFTEQTILATLLPDAGASALPKERYVLSNRGMFFWQRDLPCSDLVARHYVGTVRHLLYMHAYPYLLAQAKASGLA